MNLQDALRYEVEHPHETRQAIWDLKAALEWEQEHAKREETKCQNPNGF